MQHVNDLTNQIYQFDLGNVVRQFMERIQADE